MPKMEVHYLSCVIYFVLWGLCLGVDLQQDLKKLSQMLPGVYSNNPRTSRHFRQNFQFRLSTSQESPAEALTAMSMSAVYRPVDVTFLPDCFNVYVEQTLYGKHKPHRQWLYSFSVDESSRTIKLKVYNLLKKSLGEKISKNPKAIKYLSRNDVMTRSDCDMHWRGLGDTFVGTTSRTCVAMVNERQVRISVMTTLTSGSLQIDEGWYNTDDGSKLIELEGPILMTKIEPILDNPFLEPAQTSPIVSGEKHSHNSPSLQKDGRAMRHVKVKPNQETRRGRIRPENRLRTRGFNNKKLEYSANTIPDKAVITDRSKPLKKKYYKNKEDRILDEAILKAGFKHNEIEQSSSNKRYGLPQVSSKPKSVSNTKSTKSTWNLQTYSGVIDALINGHKLYFTARTKRCYQERATVRERTTFGDYVEVFEIGKDFTEKQPHTHVTFSFKRIAHTKTGFLDVVKELTVHRNGSVHITTVYITEDGVIDRTSFAICSLYNQDTGKGDVKFYLDPYRDVATVTKFGSLRSSLQKGKMIRMTTELDKCSGGKSDHVIVGGEFRNYDLGRNGKTIDVTLKRHKIYQSPAKDAYSIKEQFMIYRFAKQGEASIIYHNKHLSSQDNENVSIVSGYLKYKCETDPNSSTKAISLFNS